MLERLTDRALQAVVDAREVAGRARHSSVDAPHLLMGILSSQDSRGCAVLRGGGVRYDDVRAMLDRVYECVEDQPKGPLALTSQAKKLLELSRDEARRERRALVDTVDLALACSRVEFLPSIEPFIAGRADAVRRAAFSAPAMQRANAIRASRAQFKRDLATGRCAIDTALLYPPEYIGTAKVFDILLALPRFGREKVSKVLMQCGIATTRTIAGLSQRQRDELVTLLRH
jgi:hypothetical protein